MKIKVSVDDLQTGMYVAELDRPWVGTPFLFQGFLIDSEDEIHQLQECCNYVFVDDLQSTNDSALQELVHAAAGPFSSQKKGQYITVEFEEWKGAERLKETLQKLKEKTDKSAGAVEKVLNDVRLGKSVEPEESREVATKIVDTVTAHPKSAMWLTVLKGKHGYIANHSMNVSILAASFAKYIGYDSKKLGVISAGALLHDAGLARVPNQILNKPGPLTEVEFNLVKKHAAYAADIIEKKGTFSKEVTDIIRYHHERADGSGYPNGLMGDQIPEHVQIVAIADIYESMTTDKPYEKAVAPSTALTRLHKRSADHFRQDLVESFIKCIGIYPLGSLVQLKNNSLGVVVSTQEENRLKPVLLLVKDKEGQMVMPRKMINLAALEEHGLGDEYGISQIVEPEEHGIDVQDIMKQEFSMQ